MFNNEYTKVSDQSTSNSLTEDDTMKPSTATHVQEAPKPWSPSSQNTSLNDYRP